MGDAVVEVLKGVDLSIRRGEFIAIEGRSGSGKSTLLHILGALDGVDGGRVHFNGQDYTQLTFAARKRLWPAWASRAYDMLRAASTWLAELRFLYFVLLSLGLAAVLVAVAILSPRLLKFHLGSLYFIVLPSPFAFFGLWLNARLLLWLARLGVHAIGRMCERLFHRDVVGSEDIGSDLRNRRFGFVFQFYHLLPELSVLENTLLAPMIENSWFRYLLSRRQLVARARDILNQMGLSHRLEHRPSQLSGGERQRVAIARALMNQPEVLFADEPTGNLDDETGRQIMSVLEGLHRDKGQTIVMVTHDRALARTADRALILREGKLRRADEVSI
jgi:ABC-type lipoprotein export system ATPase subunit